MRFRDTQSIFGCGRWIALKKVQVPPPSLRILTYDDRVRPIPRL